MMQVSTLYAHSLERQLVSRRNQLIQNLSRSVSLDQSKTPVNTDTTALIFEDIVLSEAGIIPPELQDDIVGGFRMTNNHNFSPELKPSHEIDPKEFTDRLCKLPSQCRSSYILGAPRRHSLGSTPRLSQSTGSLVSAQSLLKPQGRKSDISDTRNGCDTFVNMEKNLKKDKRDAKKMPSNFMHVGIWTTRQNCDKLIQKVQTGDVLEFNITLHHHWGIALIPKNKKASLETIEMVHLYRAKNDTQRPIKQTLAEYWTQGVTARINNSQDVSKPPYSSGEVASISLKILSQPNKIWENTVELINFCRYGEHNRCRQASDASRYGGLSKYVDLLLSFASRSNSPSNSPKSRRKRTGSVSF